VAISLSVFRRFSFGTRLDALRPRLYRLAFSWTRDAHQADDLVQEAMARALQKHGQLRDEDMLDRWVIRIMANLWMDQLRHSAREEPIDDLQYELRVDEDQSPDCVQRRDEMIERVREAIMRLPEGQRVVVTLVDLEEFSYKDVASALDLPIGTIMSRLSRGRQALKSMLLDSAPEASAKQQRRLRRVI